MLSLQSFLRKGVSLGYVGLNYNLKDIEIGLGRTAVRGSDWGAAAPPPPSHKTASSAAAPHTSASCQPACTRGGRHAGNVELWAEQAIQPITKTEPPHTQPFPVKPASLCTPSWPRGSVYTPGIRLITGALTGPENQQPRKACTPNTVNEKESQG